MQMCLLGLATTPLVAMLVRVIFWQVHPGESVITMNSNDEFDQDAITPSAWLWCSWFWQSALWLSIFCAFSACVIRSPAQLHRFASAAIVYVMGWAPLLRSRVIIPLLTRSAHKGEQSYGLQSSFWITVIQGTFIFGAMLVSLWLYLLTKPAPARNRARIDDGLHAPGSTQSGVYRMESPVRSWAPGGSLLAPRSRAALQHVDDTGRDLDTASFDYDVLVDQSDDAFSGTASAVTGPVLPGDESAPMLRSGGSLIDYQGYLPQYDEGLPIRYERQRSFCATITFWWINRLMRLGKHLQTAAVMQLKAERDQQAAQPMGSSRALNVGLDGPAHGDDKPYRAVMHSAAIVRSIVKPIQLQISDLDPLSGYDDTTFLAHKWVHAWRIVAGASSDPATAEPVDQKSSGSVPSVVTSPSIARTLWRMFGPTYAALGLLKFCSDMISFSGPVLLQFLVNSVESTNPQWFDSFFFAALLIVSAALSAVLSSQYQVRIQRLSRRVRPAVVAAVYAKALTLGGKSKNQFTTGQITNLMSVDTDQLLNMVTSFHEFWSLPVQITVALILLYQQVLCC